MASGHPYRTRPVLIPDTSGMTRTVNPPSQLKCETSELPTLAGTSDRRNSRPTSELSTNQPENNTFTVAGQIPDTSGMNTGHVRYDQDSETSKCVEVRDVGTPDPCRDSRPSELPTYVGTPDEATREQQFYRCWTNTGHVRYEYRTRPVLPDQQQISWLFCRSNSQNSHGLA